MIKIEKNIPIEANFTGYGKWRDMLTKMEIGDSFIIPKDKSIRNAIFNSAYTLEINITTRKISDNEIRVWRTK